MYSLRIETFIVLITSIGIFLLFPGVSAQQDSNQPVTTTPITQMPNVFTPTTDLPTPMNEPTTSAPISIAPVVISAPVVPPVGIVPPTSAPILPTSRCDVITDHFTGNYQCTLDGYCQGEKDRNGSNSRGIEECTHSGNFPDSFNMDFVIKEACVMQADRGKTEYDEVIFDPATDFCFTSTWNWTLVPSIREDQYCVTYTRPFVDTFCQTLQWDANECTNANYCGCTASSINGQECMSCDYCGSNSFVFDCSNEDPSLAYTCDAIDENTMRFTELVRLYFAANGPQAVEDPAPIATPAPVGAAPVILPTSAPTSGSFRASSLRFLLYCTLGVFLSSS